MIGLKDIADISNAAEGKAVALTLWKEVVKYRAEKLRDEIDMARECLEMFRADTYDDGFTPLDPNGETSLRWAAWIERAELELAKMEGRNEPAD